MTKTPARTPEELKSAKLFTWAGDDRYTELWKGAGFNAIPLPATEISTALQTGLVNALVTTPQVAAVMQWYNNAYSGAPQNPSTGVPELCYSGKYEIVSLPPDLLTVPDWIHNHCDLSVNTLAQLLMKSPPFANQHFEIATPIMVQHLVDAGDELGTWDYEVLNQRYLFSGKVIGTD